MRISPTLLLLAVSLFSCLQVIAQQAPVEIPELDQARKGNVQQLDSSVSLATLVEVLGKTSDPAVRKSLLKGILLGLEGRREVSPPEAWQEVGAKLGKSPDEQVRKLAQQLSQIFGDEKASQQALATLQDQDAKLEERHDALASLLDRRHPGLPPVLAKLINEQPLRVAAIRGYSAFEAPEAPPLLLEHYPEWNPEEQRVVIETLATRKSYAQALLTALEKETISPDAIPVYVARSLSSLLGDSFTKKYGVKKLPGDKEALIAEYLKKANPEALAKADASAGRVVYQRLCMACHKMYGEGGIIGPDLTGSNRGDLNYLLLNALDPGGDIPDAYRMVIVTTKDGRILSGTVTAEDEQRLTLSMIGQESVVAKSDIESRETSPVSMMPEGLLQTLKTQEYLDLVKYFQTKQQVDLPK